MKQNAKITREINFALHVATLSEVQKNAQKILLFLMSTHQDYPVVPGRL
jgi:hypothetical protein